METEQKRRHKTEEKQIITNLLKNFKQHLIIVVCPFYESKGKTITFDAKLRKTFHFTYHNLF